MEKLAEYLKIKTEPRAKSENLVYCDNLRFTILTEKIIRIEYDTDLNFVDQASQLVWYRNLAEVDFKIKKTKEKLIIETNQLKLNYLRNKKTPNSKNLTIKIKDSAEIWHYGEGNQQNFKGTHRTLDGIDGAISLEEGLLSKSGWTIIDDSNSLLFTESGWLEKRSNNSDYCDLYFLAYGTQYKSILQDFSKLTGEIPLIPRWTLGNWWSRYWEYSAQDLKELMLEFKKRKLPLSVCVIDMDWHQVKNDYTTGWTGYTWNKNLFPQPIKFINWLHQQGLKTALNLHPADGVYPHEKQYSAMAKSLGINPASKQAINFDLSKLDFINAYFKFLHHPLEEQDGIDFWWLDWQQGDQSGLTGLDPLWGLNHLHYYDLGRENKKRSFIFSRWSGLGSHRYPIGFSGDTVVSWDSLKFQPYFTTTAANVLYSWWSHDIGGHCMGTEDPELYLRWLQFGVFSPIMRLHSTKDDFLDRRPWAHGAEILKIARFYLQLRHQLIPYLYTHSYLANQTAVSLLRPIYYEDQSPAAFAVPDQYFLGSELIVAPFLEPTDQTTSLSKQTIWLPAGDWFNFFDGQSYKGASWHNVYGSLAEVPVIAKAGAIVPLGAASKFGSTDNPVELELNIFPGANNSFELYEDDGAAINPAAARTKFNSNWKPKQLKFTIEKLSGNADVIPAERRIKLKFKAVKNAEVKLYTDGKATKIKGDYNLQNNCLCLEIDYQPTSRYEVVLTNQSGLLKKKDISLSKIKRIIKNFKLETVVKTELFKAVKKARQRDSEVGFLNRFCSVLSNSQLEVLIALLYDAGTAQIKTAEFNNLVIFQGELSELNYNFSSALLAAGHHKAQVNNISAKTKPNKLIDLNQLKADKWNLTVNFTKFIQHRYSSD